MLRDVMDKKKNWPVTARVDDQLYKWLTDLAALDRRSLSDVARWLLERGITAFLRDRRLFEDEHPDLSGAPPKPDHTPTPSKAKAANEGGKKESTRAS